MVSSQLETAKSETAAAKTENERIASEQSETKQELTKSQNDDAGKKQVVEDLQKQIDGLNKTTNDKDKSIARLEQDLKGCKEMIGEIEIAKKAQPETALPNVESVVSDIQEQHQNSQDDQPLADTETEKATSSSDNLSTELVVNNIQDQNPQDSPPSIDTVTDSSDDLDTTNITHYVANITP
jgi:chromosome segregation ATPase